MHSLFFWVSKLIWLVISPDNLLVILCVTAWVLLWRKRYRQATRLLGAICVGLCFMGLLPVGQWLLYPLETRFQTNPDLPETVHGIIVLGGSEDYLRTILWDQVEVGECAERDLAFLSLARQYPEATLAFSGGSGSMLHQEYKGADAARRLFQEQGLDPSRVCFERRSRNTFENVIFSKELLQPGNGQTWVLITTAWHMPRSVGICRKAGWAVTPYPVDHWTTPGRLFRIDWDLQGHLKTLTIGIKEWVGLVSYYATGKTSGLLPRPDQSQEVRSRNPE